MTMLYKTLRAAISRSGVSISAQFFPIIRRSRRIVAHLHGCFLMELQHVCPLEKRCHSVITASVSVSATLTQRHQASNSIVASYPIHVPCEAGSNLDYL